MGSLQIREWGSFSIRRYTSSVWAAVCLRGTQHEEALWRGTAELMNYIKGDNDNGKVEKAYLLLPKL